jgi:hypothetical protein
MLIVDLLYKHKYNSKPIGHLSEELERNGDDYRGPRWIGIDPGHPV